MVALGIWGILAWSGTGPTRPGPSNAPIPAAAPSAVDAVGGYLRAVAAGDLPAALAYATDPPADLTLLTPEVFAQAHRRAPISAIAVSDPDPAAPTAVTATYRLGDEPVRETFVVRPGDRGWTLDQVVAALDLSTLHQANVPVLMEGVRVESTTVSVLPGAYEVTTGLVNLDFAQPIVPVDSPSAALPTNALRPQATKAGRKAMLAAAEASFDTCLKAKSLDPDNCPFKLRSGGPAVDRKTIVWARKPGTDPFKNATVASVGTKGTVTIDYAVTLTATCTKFPECTGSDAGTNTAAFDLTAEPLKPTWAL